MNKVSKNKGFMLVEMVVAVSIITVSILAAMTVTQKSVAISRQALHQTQAAFLLEEGAEAVSVLRDNAWSNISGLAPATTYYPTFTGGTWTLSQIPNTIGIFTRTVSIAPVNRDAVTGNISAEGSDDPGTKLVTVTVSWVEPGGGTVSKSLSFYIINIYS